MHRHVDCLDPCKQQNDVRLHRLGIKGVLVLHVFFILNVGFGISGVLVAPNMVVIASGV